MLNNRLNCLRAFSKMGVSCAALTMAVASSHADQLTFVQGQNGYAGTTDITVQGAFPDAQVSTAPQLLVDYNDNGFPTQSLVRFDNLFGTGSGQIPTQATLQSASLTFFTLDNGQGGNVHRMLRNWGATDTWNTFGSGVQANNIEADSTPTAQIGAISGAGPARGTITINVTSDLLKWQSGTSNYGWAILPYVNGGDGWLFASSENSVVNQRVRLTVNYSTVPAPSSLVIALVGIVPGVMLLRRRRK